MQKKEKRVKFSISICFCKTLLDKHQKQYKRKIINLTNADRKTATLCAKKRKLAFAFCNVTRQYVLNGGFARLDLCHFSHFDCYSLNLTSL